MSISGCAFEVSPRDLAAEVAEGHRSGFSAEEGRIFSSRQTENRQGLEPDGYVDKPAHDGSVNHNVGPRANLDAGVEQDQDDRPEAFDGGPQAETTADGTVHDQIDDGSSDSPGDDSDDTGVSVGRCDGDVEACLLDGSTPVDDVQLDANPGIVDGDDAGEVEPFSGAEDGDAGVDSGTGPPDGAPVDESFVSVCSENVECAQYCEGSVDACVQQCAGHNEPVAQRVLTSYLGCARNHDCLLRSQQINSECMATHCLRSTIACRGRAYLEAESERGRCGDYLVCVEACPPQDGACLTTCWRAITDAGRHLIAELSDCVGAAGCETLECAADVCPDEWNHCVNHAWPPSQ